MLDLELKSCQVLPFFCHTRQIMPRPNTNDLILVIAVFFVATAILLPFNQGEAIHSSFLFPLYLLSVSFVSKQLK
jgi:hypothetical protein